MKKSNKFLIPVYITPVSAGFPSPAESETDEPLDLNEYVIKRPASTYMLRVKGYSMKNIGIMDGDILVVDRSLVPKNGSVIIAEIDGEFVVKRYYFKSGKIILRAENDDYQDIIITEPDQLIIWGVVTFCLRHLQV